MFSTAVIALPSFLLEALGYDLNVKFHSSLQVGGLGTFSPSTDRIPLVSPFGRATGRQPVAAWCSL